MLTTIFWVFVVPAAIAVLLSHRDGRRYWEYVEEACQEPLGGYAPPASLIVPLKGLDHGLIENIRSLARQNYPDYELLIVTRDATDESLGLARRMLRPGDRIIIAGRPPDDTGEKVHNLLAAVAQSRDASEVFAFADSDGEVETGWLRALIAPLEDDALGAATGFRWHFPEEGGFWPLLRGVWDAAIAGSMKAGDDNFAWGGGMALRRTTFDSARVAEFWRGSVSDDLRLSAAMNEAGRGIRFVPRAMVATTGTCTSREFLDWATRQLIIARVYRAGMWRAGFAAHIVYCGAMLSSFLLALEGNFLALGGFVVTVLPGMGKGSVRGEAARLMFPERQEWFDQFGWAYFWLTPVATWIWLWVFLRSLITRKIEWRGNVYELLGPQHTRCLSSGARSPTEAGDPRV